MNITLETDYAVRIIHCLVEHRHRVDAKTISEETGVTLRFSLKILRKLVSSGLICSFKGTQGGYELAKDPADISLNDVVETIEGPYTFCRCLEDGFECGCGTDSEDHTLCKFRQVYAEISHVVTDRLKEATFAEMQTPSSSKK